MPSLVRAYFLGCIARSNGIKSIFFVVSWECKQLAAIAKCKLPIVRSDNKNDHISYVILRWASNNNTIFASYCEGAMTEICICCIMREQACVVLQGSEQRQKSTIARMGGTLQGYGMAHHATIKYYILSSTRGDDNEHILNVVLQEKQQQFHFWCCKKRSYCKGASDVMTPSHDARTQQSSIINAVGCKDDSNKHHWLQGWWQPAYLFTLYCKKWQQKMVDCKEGTRNRAKQQPTIPLCQIAGASNDRGTTTLVMQWWRPTSCCKRLQWWWRGLIATSRQDCTSNKQPFFINVDQPHQWSQRHEVPAIRLTAMPQHNVIDVTIILYCHIARSNDNNRQMWGKNVTTPM